LARERATVVIVLGYGKKDHPKMREYVKSATNYALRLVKLGIRVKLVFSGGDTEDSKYWQTEAQMMRDIALELLGTSDMKECLNLEVHLEEKAYNTRTNLEYSEKLLQNVYMPMIVIFGNHAHRFKIWFCARWLVFRHVHKKIKIITYPISVRRVENLKIYIKTLIEITGWIIRPIGRKMEDIQRVKRTERHLQA
jgi:hypothetical protein